MQGLRVYGMMICSVLLLGPAAIAKEEASSRTTIKPGIFTEKSWSLAIGYSPITSSFLQNQQIGDSRVVSIDTKSQVTNNEISFRVMKELLGERRISFSLLGNLAYLKGSSRAETDSRLQYAQRAEGYQIGAGASINMNFYGLGLAIQPFLASELFVGTNTYELDYRSNGLPVVLSTKVQRTSVAPSVGVRVFDPHSSMVSFFSVGLDRVLAETITSSADVNQDGFRATGNPGTVDISDVVLRIGFGGFF